MSYLVRRASDDHYMAEDPAFAPKRVPNWTHYRRWAHPFPSEKAARGAIALAKLAAGDLQGAYVVVPR